MSTLKKMKLSHTSNLIAPLKVWEQRRNHTQKKLMTKKKTQLRAEINEIKKKHAKNHEAMCVGSLRKIHD